MKKYIFTFLMLLSFVSLVLAQYDCKVLVEDLQGQYNGDCKKGLANGNGSAKGIESYTGEFKRGYPNGFGVYIYKDSSRYIGNFKKGKKDGYGMLVRKTDTGGKILDYGLWITDSLVIPNDTKALYKVKERKGVKVIDPKLTTDESIKSQVWINFKIDGVPDKSVNVTRAEISSGKQIDTQDRALNTLVAFDEISVFPVTFYLEYQIRKTDQFLPVDCAVQIMLFTPGLWEINLNH